MTGRYDDIIHLPHHVSSDRKRMSMTDRAAQFSPFAALVGYDAAIQETGRLTDRQFEFAADGKALLDETLCALSEQVSRQPEVTITYFVPDVRKSGGAYKEIRGKIKKIDPQEQILLLTDGTVVSFDRIYEITED